MFYFFDICGHSGGHSSVADQMVLQCDRIKEKNTVQGVLLSGLSDLCDEAFLSLWNCSLLG